MIKAFVASALVASALIVALLAPGLAFADSSTDAALGLGAFAVFNQILGGIGIFHREPPAPRVVIVNPPAPQHVVVHEYYYPVPQVYQYYAAPPAWCPPGLAKKGRCFDRHPHHWDD